MWGRNDGRPTAVSSRGGGVSLSLSSSAPLPLSHSPPLSLALPLTLSLSSSLSPSLSLPLPLSLSPSLSLSLSLNLPLSSLRRRQRTAPFCVFFVLVKKRAENGSHPVHLTQRLCGPQDHLQSPLMSGRSVLWHPHVLHVQYLRGKCLVSVCFDSTVCVEKTVVWNGRPRSERPFNGSTFGEGCATGCSRLGYAFGTS